MLTYTAGESKVELAARESNQQALNHSWIQFPLTWPLNCLSVVFSLVTLSPPWREFRFWSKFFKRVTSICRNVGSHDWWPPQTAKKTARILQGPSWRLTDSGMRSGSYLETMAVTSEGTTEEAARGILDQPPSFLLK